MLILTRLQFWMWIGRIYKLYMWLLAIFCTNSINIHAGLNGLEVGQTVVIASAVSDLYTEILLTSSWTRRYNIWNLIPCNHMLQVLIHNLMQIGASADLQKQAHTFSIYLVQPLLATSLALLAYNWYPLSFWVTVTWICWYPVSNYFIQFITGILLQFLLVTLIHTLLEWLLQ